MDGTLLVVENGVGRHAEVRRFGSGQSAAARGLEGTNRSGEGTANLVVQARRRLRRSAYRELRNISCESQAGVLVLRGGVPSYYLKQLAQETLRPVAGAEVIVNLVHVLARQAS